ncbi:MAG: OB-fold domain-containing protein [Chloroflexota bacterium]|nr:OB-fold domain-containing protein [Chloroflexota bacterium]
MIGIKSYSGYVPLYRLGKSTVGWNSPVEKPIASHDEDSITMAVAAAINCLEDTDRSSIDGLYFGSTSSPYREKQAAATIATALNLRDDIALRDFTGSLRAGTTALSSAVETVKSGAAKQILVTMADVRVAVSGSDLERSIGDGAAAFLISDSEVVASIEGNYQLYDEIYDVWRAQGDTTLRSWEDRFAFDEGYLRLMPKAVAQLMAQKELNPDDFSRAVFYAPDARRLRDLTTKIGFDIKKQVEDPLFSTMGNTGVAFVPMLLVSALDKSKPGERIIVGNYGGGTDAFIFTVTPEIEKTKRKDGLSRLLESKEILPDYRIFAWWRGLTEIAPGRRRPPPDAPSASALFRERKKNISFLGVKCLNCGQPQYPPQRVCTFCHSKDKFEDYRFSDKKATLFTYSMDYVGGTMNPPIVISIVDFDGGGRAMVEMTDRNTDKISIGMPLQMTFRKLFSTQGFDNYYWRCMPPRG